MHRGLACLLLAGAVGASHVTVGGVISHTDDQYICVNLDWWPHNKCDYGTCAWKWDSMLNINLSHPLLLAAVKGLSPKPVLRLGGSLCDMVTYNITLPDNARATAAAPPLSCQPFELDNSLRVGFKGGCLGMERWLSLHAFAEAAGADVIFGINALRGRHLASPCPAGTDCRNASVETAPSCCTNWTGSWDSSNAEALLAFTAKSGLRLAGVEFGNELVGEQGIESHLAPEVYSADFQRFAEVVEKYFPSALRIAPDNGFDAAWFSSFLALAKPGTVDVVTTHEYTLGAGVDPNVVQRMMDPATLDKLKPEAAAAQKVVESMPSSPKAQLWVGEAGGAYNSGRHLATDAFMSGFWYLDNMAVHAARGHGRYCRQTLAGGNYGLLNTTTFEPNPDYYAAMAWRQLMGTAVLDTRVSGASSDVRGYSHCARGQAGAVTFLLLNLGNTSASVSLPGSGGRDEYHFTSASLHSQSVFLNGNELKVNGAAIPDLVPVQRPAASPLALMPTSYVFAVVKDPSAPC